MGGRGRVRMSAAASRPATAAGAHAERAGWIRRCKPSMGNVATVRFTATAAGSRYVETQRSVGVGKTKPVGGKIVKAATAAEEGVREVGGVF